MKLGRRQTRKSLLLNAVAVLLLVAGFWARWGLRGTSLEFVGPLLGLLGIGAFVLSQSETQSGQSEVRLDAYPKEVRSSLSRPLFTSITLGVVSLICVGLLAIAAYATRAVQPMVVITVGLAGAYVGSILAGAAFWTRFDRLQREP